ncbi:MAG: toxin TcdB middle/C-terminal domain-containing protein, partial [Micromonosporaceae bacterium]
MRYTGFRADGGSRSLPVLRFTYAGATVATSFETPPEDTADGLDVPQYRLVDLYGDGLVGVLAETGDAWYYRPNEGGGRFGARQLVAERPAYRLGQVALSDFDADGNPNLAVLHGRGGGYYTYDRDASVWQAFRPFPALPHIESAGARAQWLDVNGDGRAELVVADPGRLVWFPSLGAEGFGEPVAVTSPAGAGDATAPFAEDARVDYYFADMSGDGLVDQVRVRNGRVEYWPQLGNGHFGDPVLMQDSPLLAAEHELEPSRLFLVDLDGDGAADLLYVGADSVRWWRNMCGNGFGTGGRLALPPTVDRFATVRVADFLGDGTPCLVWSSPLPDRAGPIQYLRLTQGPRPHLLLETDNSAGAAVRLSWSSSAEHYLRDQRAGRPWRTRLPAHGPVVDRLERIDRIGSAVSASRFEYHDGRYDGEERRALFTAVDRFDSDPPTDGAPLELAATAPLCLRTWFHPGIDVRGPLAAAYTGDPDAAGVPAHEVDHLDELGPGDYERAVAALMGRPLREEAFAVGADGRLSAHPFSVTQHGYRVRRAQPGATERDPVFVPVHAQTLTYDYELAAGDPRAGHELTLEVDEYGAALTACRIAYPRRGGVAPATLAQQEQIATAHRRRYVHLDQPDRHRLGMPVEAWDFDLGALDPPEGSVYRRTELAAALAPLLAAPVDFGAPAPGGPHARLVGWTRTLYAGGAGGVLPLGTVGDPVLPHHIEQATCTPAFVSTTYGGTASATLLEDDGRYELRDGVWWRIGETHHFEPASGFRRLARTERGDGAVTTLRYDPGGVDIVEIVDALGNTTRAELDYHVLEPARLTDPNGAVAEASFDPLGVAVVTTWHGRLRTPGGVEVGYGYQPLASYGPLPAASFANVLADPGSFVRTAAEYVYYDIDSVNRPPRTVRLARQELVHDGSGTPPAGGPVATDVAVEYLDGFGRVLQSKRLTAPGPAVLRDGGGGLVLGADGEPAIGPVATRWLVSGHTVFNRKQEAVRQYEPFFSATAEFEPEEQLATFGVASAMAYDGLGRTLRHDLPNGTFARNEFGAWQARRYDPNDTVADSGYRLLREGLPLSDPERQAYEASLAHADTP